MKWYFNLEPFQQKIIYLICLFVGIVFLFVPFGLIEFIGLGIILFSIILIVKRKKEVKHINIEKNNNNIDLLREIQNDAKTYVIAYNYDKESISSNDLKTTKVGDILTLKQEPDNIFDSNAVAIYNLNKEKIGYLYKGMKQDMANKWLTNNIPIKVWLVERGDKPSIRIIFYKEKKTYQELKNSSKSLYVELLNTANKKAQDVMAISKIGDECFISLDKDSNKHIVYNLKDNALGEIPESVSRINRIENKVAYIHKITNIGDKIFKLEIIIES